MQKKIALFGRCVEILPLGVERFENLLGGRDVGNNIHLLAFYSWLGHLEEGSALQAELALSACLSL